MDEMGTVWRAWPAVDDRQGWSFQFPFGQRVPDVRFQPTIYHSAPLFERKGGGTCHFFRLSDGHISHHTVEGLATGFGNRF